MDTSNPVVQLCIQGCQAEFEHRPDAARRLYHQAWQAASDDYEACIAAHYVARFQDDPQACLHWNLIALQCAQAVDDARVHDFLASLYVNLGHAYEQVGMGQEAAQYYALAAQLGLVHQPES